MWAEVIFRTYYYLHTIRLHTDVITVVRRMAKHKSVLRQNTFKTLLKSVLPKQKVFSICWGYLLKTLSEGHLFFQK
jgi:hypothetical protein